MTRRERVMNALNFKPVDQVPKDLSGMASTGVSCFAYPRLVAALGLPPRLPRVFDTGQMLALPETDVLDALDCDVVTVQADRCNSACDEPERWTPYDFNGRLPALVMNPQDYANMPDGSVRQGAEAYMVPGSYVFDSPHAGQEFDLSAEIPKQDLGELKTRLASQLFTDERIAELCTYAKRVRESTDRAVMFNGLGSGLGYHGGIAYFSILCLTEPQYVHDLHGLMTEHACEQIRRLLPALAPYVDVLMFSADDQGTQSSTILPPDVYRDLFVPYYRRDNDTIHKVAPNVKSFLHCCGAVYELLEHFQAGGFDVMNPVQWSAGGHSYREWKDRCRGKLALWGGGVNSQSTLPLGTVADVEREAAEVVRCLAQDSGFVFCSIHNLLAEIPPEKIIALYRTAAATRVG